MSYGGAGLGAPTLRRAAAAIHRDLRWWAKCLGYGAAALSLVGLPLAAGFVMESLDNTRRGFPTPLPPWSDPSLRWLTGLFCLLIDFAFFALPLLLGGLALLCASVGLLLVDPASSPAAMAAPIALIATAGSVTIAMFILGAAPAGRLILAREGRPEEAISGQTLRWATARARRGPFLRARLASLPAYLPALALAAVTFTLAPLRFPGQLLVIVLGLWLTLSALVYAHLVVVQLYVAAEQEAERRVIGR